MSVVLQFVLLSMLTASVMLQFYAAFLAFRLIRISRNAPSWIMISVALLLMAVYRVVTFFHLLGSGINLSTDLYAEMIAFVISLLLVAGLVAIAPLMRRLNELGVDFKDLQTSQSSLEDIFVSLVRARP